MGTTSRAYVLGLLTLVYTFNHIDRQILVILLEPIKADLNLNNFDILATENRLRPPTERTSRCSAPWTVFPASRPSSFTPRP